MSPWPIALGFAAAIAAFYIWLAYELWHERRRERGVNLDECPNQEPSSTCEDDDSVD